MANRKKTTSRKKTTAARKRTAAARQAPSKRKLFRVWTEPPKGVKVELETRAEGEERSAIRAYELQATTPAAARTRVEYLEAEMFAQPHRALIAELLKQEVPEEEHPELDLSEVWPITKVEEWSDGHGFKAA